MESFITLIKETGYGRLLTSILLIAIILGIRSLLIRNIMKSEIRREDKRKWFVGIRNWTTATIFIGLGVIWATELQTFALSIIAIVGALIISGKELLLCALGGMLRTFNSMFKVGDRIEIDGIRGDVIDTNLMVTKILEVGPNNYTHQLSGRSITIPNSLYLTKQVFNESFMDDYVLHIFKYTLSRHEDWKRAEECMFAASMEACEEFVDAAQRNMDRILKKEGIDVPNAQPRITYKFTSYKEIEMIVRVPTPPSRKGQIEQQILKRFMQLYLIKPIDGSELDSREIDDD